MKQSTSILDGLQTPKLSTTSGKNTPPAASTKPRCYATFSISPLKAANPEERASVLQHQNEEHSLQKYQNNVGDHCERLDEIRHQAYWHTHQTLLVLNKLYCCLLAKQNK